MSLLWPEMLWTLWIIPVVIFAYILFLRRRRKYALRYASLLIIKEAVGRGPGFRRHIPLVLFLFALIAVTTALARPVATVMLPSQSGTVILAIDVSGSMRADDIQPSRLEAAKSAAVTFVQNQPKNVNLGVVSFSSNASIVQAPTRDREAVIAAINRLRVQQRTAIGSAILTSLDAIFEVPGNRPTPTPSDVLGIAEPSPTFTPIPRGSYAPAVIILLTDGVSNTGPSPLDVVHQAIDRGVRIYTVGMGTVEGTTLRFYGFGMRVRLDEDTLKRVAERTDGLYFSANNETDLLKVYENLGAKLVFNPEKTELTAGFTGLAAVFLMLAGILSLMWFNRLP